jgi:hypothetical protein
MARTQKRLIGQEISIERPLFLSPAVGRDATRRRVVTSQKYSRTVAARKESSNAPPLYFLPLEITQETTAGTGTHGVVVKMHLLFDAKSQ